MKKSKFLICILALIICFSCNQEEIIQPTDNEIEIDNETEQKETFSICTTVTAPTPDGEVSSTTALVLQLDKKWTNGQELRVEFLSGTFFQQEQVREIAPIWSENANISFEFVQTGESDIRIEFHDDTTNLNNSYVGTDALSIDEDEETMNLSFDESSGDLRIRQVILHEFGHALGLKHEHQHPENGINWDKEAVYEHFDTLPENQRWSRDKVDQNIFDILDRDQTNFSRYDSESIMHYSFPSNWTIDGFSAPWNSDLSDRDICFIGELYPNTANTAFDSYGFGLNQGPGWFVGDYNGDGIDDLMRFKNENGGAEVALSTGGSFQSPVEWSGFGERGGEGWYVGDYNGDGKDDIMRYKNENGGAHVLLSTGSSFQSPVEWSGFGERGGRGWYVGDYNGDGKDDIMRYKNENGGAHVLLSTGSSFQSPVEWSGFGERGGEGWYVGDYNGDGKDDIMRYKNENGGAHVLLSTGSSFQSPVEWSGFGERGGRGWYVGDYNGDGLSDLIRLATSHFGGAQVTLSFENRFGSIVTWNNHEIELDRGRGWYIGDFNGDNNDDILRFLNENGGAVVYLSGGECFPIFL